MGEDVSSQIARLPSLPRPRLLDLWQRLYGRSAPVGIRREIIVPFLAYTMQERAYGGLKSSTRSELRRIARGLERAPRSSKLKPRPRIKLGTRLLRAWRGVTHEVIVTESGYEYRGVSYTSLSKIACKITGTRWSGPAFFGLNNAHPVSNDPRD